MRVASFTADSAYRHSLGLDFEHGVFSIVNSGTTTPTHVAQLDAAGELLWVSADLRSLALQFASAPQASSPSPTPSPGQTRSVSSGAAVTPSASSTKSPRISRRAKKVALKVVALTVSVLLLGAIVYKSYWVIRDSRHPVTVRLDGEIPNLANLIGMEERDAERALGTLQPVSLESVHVDSSGKDHSVRETSGMLFSEDHSKAVDHVSTFTLPDLNRLDARPLVKQGREESELAIRLVAQEARNSKLKDFDGRGYDGDAALQLEVGRDGRVLGTQLSLSGLVLGRATSSVVDALTAVGVIGAVDVSPKPGWCNFDISTVFLDGFGRGSAGSEPVDCYVRGMQAAGPLILTSDPYLPLSQDAGDVSIYVSRDIIDWVPKDSARSPKTSPPSSETPRDMSGSVDEYALEAVSKSGQSGNARVQSAYADSTYMVIFLSDSSTDLWSAAVYKKSGAEWRYVDSWTTSWDKFSRAGLLAWMGSKYQRVPTGLVETGFDNQMERPNSGQ